MKFAWHQKTKEKEKAYKGWDYIVGSKKPYLNGLDGVRSITMARSKNREDIHDKSLEVLAELFKILKKTQAA